MAKETKKRLIQTLEFLKEPQGSTIPSIVKAMNGEGPHVSLKKIVQTLRGCLESGIVKVSDGKVKLKTVNVIGDAEEDKKYCPDSTRPKSGCQKPLCSKSLYPKKCSSRKSLKMKGTKPCPKTPGLKPVTCDEGSPPDDGDGEKTPCPPCPKCPKKKKKPKCPKPKPKCPKPKPKCPKPKPKCPKPKKPKCKPKKPKCKPKKPKSNPKKSCKKPKIQPYCKKKKLCF